MNDIKEKIDEAIEANDVSINDDAIKHYGVIGMKWGRRKAGPPSDDAARYHKNKSKDLSELSNNELRQVNERSRLEQEYRSLNPSTIQRGAKAVAIATAAIGTTVKLIENSGKLIAYGKKVVKKKP